VEHVGAPEIESLPGVSWVHPAKASAAGKRSAVQRAERTKTEFKESLGE
jgi:hypothetical protein